MSWNRNDSNSRRGAAAARKPRVSLVLLVPLVLLALAVGVWFAVRGHAGRVTRPDREGRAPSRPIAEAAPGGGQAVARPADADVAGSDAPASPNAGKESEDKKPGVFAPGMIRLPNGFELRFKLPAEGETRQLLAGGEIWEIDSKGNIENVTPPPVFEKPFEGMISSLYERDGMVLPFALKRYSEKEVRKMCREPTLSYEDDTEEITRKRENVAMLKRAILEFLDGGGKFEEFVDDMLQHSQKAQRAQIEGVHGVRDLLEAGKDAEAVQYYRLFSQDMSDKGYGELKLPRSYKAALEEIEAKEKDGK